MPRIMTLSKATRETFFAPLYNFGEGIDSRKRFVLCIKIGERGDY